MREILLQRIKIITDSTCDLPQSIVTKYDVKVVPLNVYMDDEVFTAGIDLTSSQFYDKMPLLKDTPSTSPPSPAAFYEAYEDVSNDADSIISIHISRLMSETIIAAEQARNMLPHLDIRIFDSYTTGASLGLVILEAIRAIEEGRLIDDVCVEIENTIKNVRVIGFPNTLKYLIKGGRIGRARGLVGRLLGRIPILTVEEGEVSSLTTAQGIDGAMEWIVDFLKEEGLDSSSSIALTHGNLQSIADQFNGLIIETFACRPKYTGLVGPVVGAHLGPGSLFFAYIKK